MTAMTMLSDYARSAGDPKVVETGRSSLPNVDRWARNLGWFSLALGATELFAPRAIARSLGMQGREPLLRAYGMREIGAGMLTLSTEKQTGVWSRVAGDGLDIATLLAARRRNNPKRDNVGVALALVIGITAVDLVVAQLSTTCHARGASEPRLYHDRSGFPGGIAAARGAARPRALAPAE
jgi:hypothetical protein